MTTVTDLMAQVRELPPEEWPRLAPYPPFNRGLPNPEHSRIIVAELGGPGGELVAYWGIFTAVHVEPLWIHPDHRRRPGLIRRLWLTVRQTLLDSGVLTAFAAIADRDAAQNIPLAMRIGFDRFAGDLYFVQLQPPVPTDLTPEPEQGAQDAPSAQGAEG